MTDALFWYGCNMTRHAEIIRLGTAMLAAVGVGAQPVGGPSACCGSPKESTPRIAEGMANRTMQRFNQSGAGQVITWCPTCHMNLDDFMGATQGKQADSAHLAQALWDRREALTPLLTRRVDTRVLIDLHLGNGTGVNQAVPGLLRLIPGLEVMEHPYRAPSYMCFGLASIPGALDDARASMLSAMRQTGADTLVTIFHSCHRELVGLERSAGIRVLNWVHLLADGMGWPYEDEYKAWRNSPDPEAAIGAARMAAAGEEAVRRLVLPELRRP